MVSNGSRLMTTSAHPSCLSSVVSRYRLDHLSCCFPASNGITSLDLVEQGYRDIQKARHGPKEQLAIRISMATLGAYEQEQSIPTL